MVRRLLLLCGVLFPILYAVADALAGLRWEGYSFRDQTISELGAIGAPTRLFFSAFLIPAYLLLVAFGVGVWRSADGRRKVRIAGAMVIAFGAVALAVGQFVPMRPRGVDQGMAGALHLAEGAVEMIVLFTAMGFAAAALGRSFRVYTLVTIAVVLVFGAWVGIDAPRLAAGLSTPWLGVKERVLWYAYELWFLGLAVTLLRHRREEDDPS